MKISEKIYNSFFIASILVSLISIFVNTSSAEEMIVNVNHITCN